MPVAVLISRILRRRNDDSRRRLGHRAQLVRTSPYQRRGERDPQGEQGAATYLARPRAHATTRLISRLETTSPRCVAPPCAFNSSSSGSSHLGHRAPWTTSSSGTSAFPDLLSQSSGCGCDALRPGERRAPGGNRGHHLTTLCANITVQDQRWPGMLFARGLAAGERGTCYGTRPSIQQRH